MRSKGKLWEPPHSQSLPQILQMGEIIYYPETLLKHQWLPLTPRVIMKRRLLAGPISDGQNPEHRPGRGHPLAPKLHV